MDKVKHNLLLIEDNPGDAHLTYKPSIILKNKINGITRAE